MCPYIGIGMDNSFKWGFYSNICARTAVPEGKRFGIDVYKEGKARSTWTFELEFLRRLKPHRPLASMWTPLLNPKWHQLRGSQKLNSDKTGSKGALRPWSLRRVTMPEHSPSASWSSLIGDTQCLTKSQQILADISSLTLQTKKCIITW